VADLASARAKLARACDHLEVFNREVREYFGSDPYPLTHEFDYLDGLHRWYADMSAPLPDHWPALIGDCLQNLRSALDHLAWQFAGAVPGDSRTQFPIFDDPDKFRKYGLGRIENITGHPHALIKWLQPYRRADMTDHPIFLVQVFNAEDKHKAITLTGTVIDKINPIHGPFPPGSTVSIELSGENLPVNGGEPKALLAEARASYTGPGDASGYYMDVELKPTFGVAMSAEAKGLTVTRANEALRDACECIGRVLDMFERYA